MMVYDTRKYPDFSNCPSSGSPKTGDKTFRKMRLFPSSGEGGRSLSVGSVKNAEAIPL
jgi:hypothetical protein